MSPTLDLIDDCFSFVTGFFPIIKESAPHIYHSALPQSPKTSIVRTLYEPLAHPLTRIVCGLPTSWEQSGATMEFKSAHTAVWSPCSRFIAISWSNPRETIGILDALTLVRLATLSLPPDEWHRGYQLVFSPDGHLLTQVHHNPGKLISWDVQTGVLVSTIVLGGHNRYMPHCTYSACGTMLGVFFHDNHTYAIHTYNISSGICVSSHLFEGPYAFPVWTHGECLQFATRNSESFTIWEVGFTSTHTPTEIKSLCVPSRSIQRPIVTEESCTADSSYHAILCPTSTPIRLALITGGTVMVWDAQNSKSLLDFCFVGNRAHAGIEVSFSPDGHFFTCGLPGHGIYLWKESPTGYTLHQRLIPGSGTARSYLSPNGELIIALDYSGIQLWHTTNSTTFSVTPNQGTQDQKSFIFEFSPDETLAAITWRGDEMVTILDLKSGIPQLIINTSMRVYGLGVGESTIIVVGDGKIVTWDLPSRDSVFNPEMNLSNSIQITTFTCPDSSLVRERPVISVSPNSHCIAIIYLQGEWHSRSYLCLIDASTGECFGKVKLSHCIYTMEYWDKPWFTQDGHEVWCITTRSRTEGWRIVEGSEPNVTKLEHIGLSDHLPDGPPWEPSGYKVTDDRWTLSSSGKKLLQFPPHWRLFGWRWIWGRQFLVLLHHRLPEPIILELE